MPRYFVSGIYGWDSVSMRDSSFVEDVEIEKSISRREDLKKVEEFLRDLFESRDGKSAGFIEIRSFSLYIT